MEKELKALFDELEPEAYKTDIYCYPVKEAHQIIRKHFEKLQPNDRTAKILEMVNEQAEDEGIWFEAETAPEAYLQQELRKLHGLIERTLKDNNFN